MSVVCLKNRKELLWLEHREAGRWGHGTSRGFVMQECTSCGKKSEFYFNYVGSHRRVLSRSNPTRTLNTFPFQWKLDQEHCLLGCFLQRFSHGGIAILFPPVDWPTQGCPVPNALSAHLFVPQPI